MASDPSPPATPFLLSPASSAGTPPPPFTLNYGSRNTHCATRMGDNHPLIPQLLHSEQDFLNGVYRLLGQPFGSSSRSQPPFLPDFLAQLKRKQRNCTAVN